jgi:hypothetical protein
MKECKSCLKVMPFEQFVKNKNKSDGHHTVCKVCTKTYKAKYYQENKDRLLSGFKARYLENSEKYKSRQRELRNSNPEIYNQRVLEYQKLNKDKVNKRHKDWEAQQRQTNPQFKIRSSIRGHLNSAIKRNSKRGVAIEQLGCSIEYYKDYLSKKFKHDMTWDNRGSVWSIDHIIPLSAFDLTDAEQLKQACHYTNTQPLYITENNRKGGVNRRKY